MNSSSFINSLFLLISLPVLSFPFLNGCISIPFWHMDRQLRIWYLHAMLVKRQFDGLQKPPFGGPELLILHPCPGANYDGAVCQIIYEHHDLIIFQDALVLAYNIFNQHLRLFKVRAVGNG